MRQILLTLYILLNIIPIYSREQQVRINLDGVRSIIIYPPIYSDTTVIISDYRINFWNRYSKTNIKRKIIKSSESITEIIELLEELKFIEHLGYSNSNPATVLQVDSVGNPFWKSITPPLIGQIVLYRKGNYDIIWLTTEGVEIDGKLYRYSTELWEYFSNIRNKHLYNSKLK